jgi:hypothetical protein
VDLHGCRDGLGRQAEQAPDCPFGELDVVRCASGKLDSDRFERGEEGTGGVPGGGPGGIAPLVRPAVISSVQLASSRSTTWVIAGSIGWFCPVSSTRRVSRTPAMSRRQ